MKTPPLTAAQQELVLSEDVRKTVWGELRRVPPGIRRADPGHWLQEAWLAAAVAAATFDPVLHPGVPFGAYARKGIRDRLRGKVAFAARRFRVWNQPPELDPDGHVTAEPADHRGAGSDPALHAWCSPEYTRQRRCLDWRTRLVLYLRCVEGWTLEETSLGMGISNERARQLQSRGVQKLAAFRVRRRREGVLPGQRKEVP